METRISTRVNPWRRPHCGDRIFLSTWAMNLSSVGTVLEEHGGLHAGRLRARGSPWGLFAHTVEYQLQTTDIGQIGRDRRLRYGVVEHVEVHPGGIGEWSYQL